ncbi:transglycosylase SLT domain-containing protein [Vibrio lentus]|nr:transglycosylase SLT domain-containing protein [Vibrio lentus]
MSAQGVHQRGQGSIRVKSLIVGRLASAQVLPSTAKDKNVNIKSIHKVDNNIHAGVKYMRFIKDRYFNDTITADNQIYFTLASYNAGPAKNQKNGGYLAKKGCNHARLV